MHSFEFYIRLAVMNKKYYLLKHTSKVRMLNMLFLMVSFPVIFSCTQHRHPMLQLQKNAPVLLIGNNLGSRMMSYGHFETELHVRYPDSTLYIRNICDPGETPGFRP